VDDEPTFLRQFAAQLRTMDARTLVARRAYDQAADQLMQLAAAGEHEDLRPAAPEPPACERPDHRPSAA
jgi:hypothetical protein